MSRRLGSFKWLATQSVVTRTSGCAYSVINSSSRNILSGQILAGSKTSPHSTFELILGPKATPSGNSPNHRRIQLTAQERGPSNFEPKNGERVCTPKQARA